MNIFFGGAILTSADILLMLIGAVLIIGLVIGATRFFLSNLMLARSTRNKKARRLALSSFLVFSFLVIFFNLYSGGQGETFILVVLSLGLFYIQQQVNRQLRQKLSRRSKN